MMIVKKKMKVTSLRKHTILDLKTPLELTSLLMPDLLRISMNLLKNLSAERTTHVNKHVKD
tara:strand:+ start:260 stop:442 length:183 start_codon:yes stop_codon:yes gene_type:complete